MRFDLADEALLCRAIPRVISGNFGLRIRAGGDRGYEQHYSDQPATFEVLDTDALEETVAALKKTPISPLFDAPLYRLYVLRAADAVWFFGAFHHLIADGTTLNAVLPARLCDCMEALRQGGEWTAPKASYDEYLRRVTEYLASPESMADREYWLKHLSAFQGAGYQAPALTKRVLSCDIPEALTAKWLPFQAENRISPFVLALGAVFAYWQGLRARLGSRHDDMVWEISVNGRYFGDDIAREPGMYVETLPLRLTWDGGLSFSDLLQSVKSVMKAGLSHAKTSGNEYFPELQKQGADLRALTSFSAVDNGVSGGTTGFDAVGGETDVPFHVRVNFNRNNREGIQHLDFEYNGDIFDEAAVLEIRDGVLGILEQAADNPDIRLNALVLSPSRLIAAECWVEENLAQADEPTALQCGGLHNAPENGTGTLKVALAADRATLTAGLAALLTRFGMSREILIGVRSGREVLPFGMKVDTAMPARAFRSLVDEKLSALDAVRDYPLSCRTDVDFKPDIILSFCTPEADSDAEIALYVSEDGVHVVLCDAEQMVNPMAIAALVKQHGVDALGATPTRLLQYSEIPAFCEALRGVRVMIVGGEGFPGRLFRVIREYSDCEIYNSYGPTEVTIASHQKRMDSERVSAGYPMLNVWDRICDADGGELPPYAVGELYVGGAGVAIGYFHNDALTAERFPVIDGERWCNTGDLAWRDDAGEVFVLGRNDGMIKLRGLRIELEEIENTLGRFPGVTQARVIVKNVQGRADHEAPSEADKSRGTNQQGQL